MFGADYISLPAYCAHMNASFKIDSLTRAVEISKNAHKIDLVVGDKFALIDGQPHTMGSPVTVIEGDVFVSDQFRRVVMDFVFGSKPLSVKRNFPLGKVAKVVVDAGHGGKDPGAISRSGLEEKTVTLDIAKRVASLLREEGAQVEMTRSTDVFIPLEKRVDITNDESADIFVSIHANANPSRVMKGFEVYYISPAVSDLSRAVTSSKRRRLNMVDSFSGEPSSSLKAAIWDMMYTYSRAEAIELSRSICHAVGSSIDVRVLGVKNANFCVLRGASLPAVLVEVGFLSISQEAERLNSGMYRQKLARGIVDGIREYAIGKAAALNKNNEECVIALSSTER
jgi:N-acetylmuramoyl-L-alanine amidase